MGPALVPTLIAAAACGAALTGFLRVAARAGLVDDGADAPDRKPQKGAVPLVGGPAIAFSVLALVVLGLFAPTSSFAASASIAGYTVEPFWFVAALLAAFATGFVDDRAARGLGPIAKLCGQALAALLLAHGLRDAPDAAALGAHASTATDASMLAAASIGAQILCALCAIVAMNAANTFDNADGALAGIATLGLAAVSPLAGATAVFWPFNLWLRRRASDTPLAYLGDSGSHLLGLVLFATPVGRAALVVPFLDIVRVVFERWRAGAPIWHGDRRHLAHRLQDAGRGRTSVVALLLACSLPAVLGTLWAPHAAGAAAWILVSALFFAIVVIAYRPVR
jgi:UDP-GlcNAc:undecaprenyl-phosphate/decaprenyl-phosphate GlcNAc-1-phosphate transferase